MAGSGTVASAGLAGVARRLAWCRTTSAERRVRAGVEDGDAETVARWCRPVGRTSTLAGRVTVAMVP